MAAERDPGMYVQTEIPKFDGHYDHWAMLMEVLLRSKEYWQVVESGIPVAGENATPEEKKAAEEGKQKDLKARIFLYQALDRGIIETIINGDTSKGIWDSLKLRFKGSSKVKHAQLQVLKREFEILTMKD